MAHPCREWAIRSRQLDFGDDCPENSEARQCPDILSQNKRTEDIGPTFRFRPSLDTLSECVLRHSLWAAPEARISALREANLRKMVEHPFDRCLASCHSVHSQTWIPADLVRADVRQSPESYLFSVLSAWKVSRLPPSPRALGGCQNGKRIGMVRSEHLPPDSETLRSED